MTGIQPEVGPGTLLLMAVFGLAVGYVAVGNFVLFLIMKSKGSRMPASLGSLALSAYFREGPRVRSKALDRFALSLALSIPVALATAILLYPRVWS